MNNDGTKPLNALEFLQRFPEVQSRRIRASQVFNDSLVNFSGTATASGTVGGTQNVFLTTTLEPTGLYKTQTNFAIPYVAVYGTTSAIGSMQIFPGVGSGITPGRFQVAAGFDYAQWDANGTPASSLYRVAIYNSGTVAADIYAVTLWRYVQNNAGVSG